MYWKDWCWIWLQYFGHLMERVDSVEKTLMLGMKDWGPEDKGQQKARWLDLITDSMDMSLRKLLERVKGREAWWAAVHGLSKNQTQLSDWGRTHTHTHTHNTPWYIYIIYLSIDTSTDTWAASLYWLMWIMLQWIWERKYLLESPILIPLD